MQLTQLSALRVRPVSAPARVAGARIAVLPRRTIRMRAETEQKAEQAADKAADTAKEGADQVQQGAQDAANKVEQSLPSGAKGDQGVRQYSNQHSSRWLLKVAELIGSSQAHKASSQAHKAEFNDSSQAQPEPISCHTSFLARSDPPAFAA